MADIKELHKHSKELSLLYIDEDQQFLQTMTENLSKIFAKTDDAKDATEGLSNLRLNEYDIVIVDANSTIMNSEQLASNFLKLQPTIQLIVTYKDLSETQLLQLYKLGTAITIAKPFTMGEFLDELYKLLIKISHQRLSLQPKVEELLENVEYERKRIGRFMLNEKKYTQTIQEFRENMQMSRNVYELTRLPSRYALQDALNGQKQAVLYLNIDHFDFVNSVYGMGKGNKLLKECAARLNKFLPQNGELFHITADEFVIVLDDPAKDQETSLAKQIQSLFKEAEIEFDDYSHFVHFSIGIDKGEGKILFVNAKSASKESRYYGGNKITVYNPKSAYIQEQKENLYWIQTLKKAFEEDRFHNYYQAIKSINTRQTKHYEVLCRLEDEEGNFIDALEFIKNARLIGLISHITKGVIDKAFKMFSTNEFHFSLNISMYDLHENYLVKFLKYKCEKYYIDPSRVYIEVLKDVILTKDTNIDQQLLELKKLGFHIVIDNFGSDALVYNRILELRADCMKLDGELIKKLNEDKGHTIIVKSLLDFAKAGDIKIIAEHVEDKDIFSKVKQLGIEYVQGFAISKPSLKLT